MVSEVGAEGTGFAPGDGVAVGNIVDSCGRCRMCRAGQENYCEEFPTLTYGGTDRQDGSPTRGAYASEYVVGERFAYRLPAELDPAGIAPLMCAGITVWEPLQRWEVGPGKEVGVVGLGGLGHLAVRLGHALGARVSVFTTSPAKADDPRRLGAAEVIVSTDGDAIAAARDRFDLIIDTAASPHDLTPYLRTVALNGTLCSLGVIDQLTYDAMAQLVGRRSVASAGSGGRPETQALLDFCASRGITADVEVLPSRQVNTALDRVVP